MNLLDPMTAGLVGMVYAFIWAMNMQDNELRKLRKKQADNARLLTVCRALDDYWSHLPPGIHDGIWSEAITAIAKAEGK